MKQYIKIFSTQRIDLESVTIENDIIQPVRCGAVFDKSTDTSIQGDNEGDNISEKHMTYCELTTQYWAWKNVEADYYGFCHYRRYFSFNNKHLEADDWNVVVRPFLNDSAIEELQTDEEQIKKRVLPYDVLLPSAIQLELLNFKSVYNQYEAGHYLNNEDIDLVLDIVGDIYPEFLSAAEEYFEGKTLYVGNLFIMKKVLFHAYSKWLFDILDEFEKRWDSTFYSEEGLRTPGHIGERLLGVYMHWLQRQNKYKFGELQMVLFEDTKVYNKALVPAFEKNNVPTVFSSSEYFAPYCATAIKSIMLNANATNNYDIIILETEISDVTKDRIKAFVEDSKNFSVRFINVKHIMSNYSLRVREHFTVETYFRLLIPAILPAYDKILYLDGDIIAKADVADLYNIDIGNNAVAAAKDVVGIGLTNGYPDGNPDYYKYRVRLKDIRNQINGGVMLINCKRIRESYSMDELLEYAQISKFELADQDCIISLFQDELYYLDLAWNAADDAKGTLRQFVATFAPKALFDAYNDAIANPKIIHYAGSIKPWMDPSYKMAEEFWIVARQTPFYEILTYRRVIENASYYTDLLKAKLKREKMTLKGLTRRIADILFPLNSRHREFAKKILKK